MSPDESSELERLELERLQKAAYSRSATEQDVQALAGFLERAKPSMSELYPVPGHTAEEQPMRSGTIADDSESTASGRLPIARPQLGFTALVIGCFVFLRRFIAHREIAMAVYTALTPVAVVVSIFAPGEAGFSLRLFVGVVFLFAWLAVTSVFVSRTQSG